MSGMTEEFACKECGDFAVLYPINFDDDAPVICARCETFVSTYREFRCRAERGTGASPNGERVTGC